MSSEISMGFLTPQIIVVIVLALILLITTLMLVTIALRRIGDVG